MLKPGEKVIAAVPFRDTVLVFGSEGTVLELFYDYASAFVQVRYAMNLTGARP